jgi:Resolvase, N terminal domain
VDNDKSALGGRHHTCERMLADIRPGLIDAVVVWDLDRLHRRPIALEHFITPAGETLCPRLRGRKRRMSTDNGRLFARSRAGRPRGNRAQTRAKWSKSTSRAAQHFWKCSCLRPPPRLPGAMTPSLRKARPAWEVSRNNQAGFELPRSQTRPPQGIVTCAISGKEPETISAAKGNGAGISSRQLSAETHDQFVICNGSGGPIMLCSSAFRSIHG